MPLKVLVVILIIIAPLIPTFWALQDVPKRRFPTPKKKIVWFLVVSTLPFFGAMLYLIFARRDTEALELS